MAAADATARFLDDHREELVRLSLQLFGSLGLTKAAEALEAETGVRLQDEDVTRFKAGVLDGDWAAVAEVLPKVTLADAAQEGTVRYLIAQQRYCELLSAGDHAGALGVLQSEVAPLAPAPEELHALAALLACPDGAALARRRPGWTTPAAGRAALLSTLATYISGAALVPENRLCTLLQQGQAHQRAQCVYWNRRDGRHTLLADCEGSGEDLPRHTNLVLRDHRDEVWDVAFSHNGRQLATGSKDARVVVYDLTEYTASRGDPKVHCQLLSHGGAVVGVRWAPDDRKLLSYSEDHTLKLWDTRTGGLLRTFAEHAEGVLSACWCPDGEHLISSGADRRVIKWHVDGTVVHARSVPRVLDMCVSPDGAMLVTADSQNRLTCYRMDAFGTEGVPDMALRGVVDPTAPHPGLVRSARGAAEEGEPLVWRSQRPDAGPVLWAMEERHYIGSCTFSKCGRYLACAIHVKESRGRAHVYDVRTLSRVQKITDPRQLKYALQPTFGGALHNFIVMGSEDGKVYVAHRETGETLSCLAGHTGTVNAYAPLPQPRR